MARIRLARGQRAIELNAKDNRNMLEGLPSIGALKNYLELATGLTEVTASKAKDAAFALIAQGMSLGTKQPAEVAASVQQAADDLVAMSKTNRDMLVGMIRTEVDRTVGRMGFVREDELAALRARVEKLEAAGQERIGNGRTGAQHDESEDKTENEREPHEPIVKKKKVIVNE